MWIAAESSTTTVSVGPMIVIAVIAVILIVMSGRRR